METVVIFCQYCRQRYANKCDMLQILQTTRTRRSCVAHTADKKMKTTVMSCKVMMVMRSDLTHMDMPASGASQLNGLARLCSQKPDGHYGAILQTSRLSCAHFASATRHIEPLRCHTKKVSCKSQQKMQNAMPHESSWFKPAELGRFCISHKMY